MKQIAALVLCILIAACTEQAAYNTLQTSGRSHAACEAIQDTAEAQRCEADFNKPYEVYARERKQVLSQQDDPALRGHHQNE